MKPEQLTIQHLEQLYVLYAQFFFTAESSRSLLYVTDGLLVMIVNDLLRYGSYTSRVGSKWTPHSKLDISLDNAGDVRAKFEPNFDRVEKETYPEKYQEALATGDAFSRAFMEYLSRL